MADGRVRPVAQRHLERGFERGRRPASLPGTCAVGHRTLRRDVPNAGHASLRSSPEVPASDSAVQGAFSRRPLRCLHMARRPTPWLLIIAAIILALVVVFHVIAPNLLRTLHGGQ